MNMNKHWLVCPFLALLVTSSVCRSADKPMNPLTGKPVTALAGLLQQSPHETVRFNAAKALGESHRLGSVEAGKLADLCAIRMDSLQTTPMYDVISHLIYAASSQQVSHVWVGGRMLLQDAQFLHLDVDGIIGRAGYWAERIKAENGMARVKYS